MKDLYTLYCECDDLVRMGQVPLAKKKLERVLLKSIPRHLMSVYAELYRRVGQPKKSLGILSPVIHSIGFEKNEMKNQDILVEYAIGLQRIGAIEEAISWLKCAADQGSFKVAMGYVNCYFNVWDYQSAIPILETQVSNQDLLSYHRCLAMINLMSAYEQVGRYKQAIELSKRALPLMASNGWNRLEANLHEILSGVYCEMNLLGQAKESLSVADQKLTSAKTLDRFFIEKRKAIIHYRESGNDSPLLKLKRKAKLSGQWEVVRDIDFELLKNNFDCKLQKSLVNGTRFEKFRQKVIEVIGPIKEVDSMESSGKQIFDLANISSCGKVVGKFGSLIHRLLCVVAADSYSPIPLGEIFNRVFVDEQFNIDSSPNKIYQLVNRTRKYLKAAKVDIQLIENNGQYSLKVGANTLIRPVHNFTEISTESGDFLALKSNFGHKQFNSKRAAEALGTSLATAKRRISRLIEEGKIKPVNAGARRAYQLSEIHFAA